MGEDQYVLEIPEHGQVGAGPTEDLRAVEQDQEDWESETGKRGTIMRRSVGDWDVLSDPMTPAAPDALRVRIEALIERCRGNYADDAGGGEPLRNYVLIEELRALLEDGTQ